MSAKTKKYLLWGAAIFGAIVAAAAVMRAYATNKANPSVPVGTAVQTELKSVTSFS